MLQKRKIQDINITTFSGITKRHARFFTNFAAHSYAILAARPRLIYESLLKLQSYESLAEGGHELKRVLGISGTWPRVVKSHVLAGRSFLFEMVHIITVTIYIK
jgi:hypothetical protein